MPGLSDNNFYPQDTFRLQAEGSHLVLQRLEATMPMAMPRQQWVTVTPEMYCSDPDLAVQISRRLAITPAGIIQLDARAIERRGMIKGAIGGVVGVVLGTLAGREALRARS